MNISKLKKGMVLKNYKELCGVLEIETKTSNSKVAQIKELERHCTFHKEGNKFVIDRIHKETKRKVDNRGKSESCRGNNKVDYIPNIELLILDLLAQDRNNGQVFLSKNVLLKELRMINGNYAYSKQYISKLSKFTDVSEAEIGEFYDSTDSTLKRNLESTLNSLKKQSLIDYSLCKTVCYLEVDDTQIEERSRINRFGEEEIDYKLQSKIQKTKRKATKEEVKLILYTERELLKELGCKNKQELRAKGLWQEFKRVLNRKLIEKGNIAYYYESYEIIFNEEHIVEKYEDVLNLLLKDEDRKEHHDTLNQSILNRLCENAERRKKTTLKNKERLRKYPYRKNENYLERQKAIMNTVIDHKEKNLIEEIRKSDI